MIFSISPTFASQVKYNNTDNYTLNPLQGLLSGPSNETQPDVEFTDSHNGTTLTVIDYGNGTLDRITETHINKTAKLQVVNETASQLLCLPTSEESNSSRSTDYKNSTQTVTMEQQLLMGFTCTLIKERWQWDVDKSWWVFTARVCVGIELNISFGLRLPVKVTVKYPEQMTVDHNYTFYATITAIDKPNYKESIFVFKTYAWLDAEVLGFKYHKEWGPNYDFSQSFKTPIGIDMAFPFGSIPLPDALVDCEVLAIKLGLAPGFGSKKVTAKTKATGDAILIEGANLTWSMDNQSFAFTVQASDCDPTTDNATIQLWDFRYYFTEFYMGFDLIFDFTWPLDTLISDFPVRIYTLDLSELIQQFNWYLGVHEDYPESVDVDVFVKRFGVQIIQVNPPSVNIKPTETAIFEVFIVNIGNLNDTFKLSLQGIPDNWSHNFSEVQFELKPGTMTKSQLSVKPPESIIGQFAYNVTVCSLTAPLYDLEATDLQTITITLSSVPPLQIDILSPQNKTYPVRTVPLNFTVDKPTSWIGYSLDNHANVTITGNTTLTSLSEGQHNIIVYANDTSNNMGSSSRIHFTILSPVHDVAVTSVVPSVTEAYQGNVINIDVTVKNNGTEHETFNVTAYYNNTNIGTKNDVSLNPSFTETLTFNWDTSSIPLGSYTLKAEACQVPNETNTSNNVKINGQVLIQEAPPTQFKLTVNVVDNTATPILSARVEVNGETKITDGETVEFILEKGNYTVTASKEYYTSISTTVNLNQNTSLTLILTPLHRITVTSSPVTGIAFIINGLPQTTPYTEWLPEFFYTLEMPETYNGYVWSHWLEDGDTNRTKTIYLQGTTWTGVYEPKVPVGGVSVPIHKTEPLVPWRGLALLLIVSAVALSVVHVKHRKKRQNEVKMSSQNPT